MKKYFFIITLGLVMGVYFVWEEPAFFNGALPQPVAVSPVSVPPAAQEPAIERTSRPVLPEPVVVPPPPRPEPPVMGTGNVLLDVPFQPQAPFGQWSQPWQDACEEASLVLANRFAHGTTTLSREEMRDEILRLVEFQNGKYGDYKDSDAMRTAEIGREVYGLTLEVREVSPHTKDFGVGVKGDEQRTDGIDEIKQYIREGKLVVAPMAGRELHNPYFTPPGPLYHMVIIRGFDERSGEFITNDIGTRRGESLRYPYERIWKALHDFPGEKERILEGAKKIIVISPSSE
jgi:hypothetical protein